MVLTCIEYLDFVQCPFKFFAHFCIVLSVLFLLILKCSFIHSGCQSFIRCICCTCPCVCRKYLLKKYLVDILNLLKCICLILYYQVVIVLLQQLSQQKLPVLNIICYSPVVAQHQFSLHAQDFPQFEAQVHCKQWEAYE